MCEKPQEMGHSQIPADHVQSPKDFSATIETCTPNTAPTMCECRKDTFCGHPSQKMPPKIYTSPIPGQEVGETNIDFFKELIHLRSCHLIACKILSYLDPKDLRSVCCVSRAWKAALLLDGASNTKRLRELDSLKKKLFKVEEENEYPKYARGPLGNIGNFVEVKLPKGSAHEPPVPSRYQLFREEAKKLLPCESLQPCPRCTSPSRVDPYLKRGLCTRDGCAYNFCTKCCCQYHDLRPCPVASKPRPLQRDLIGSKASRRNLKRL